MQIQNKLIDSNSPQNQNSFHINNFRKYVVVTSSTHNLTINHKNIIKNNLNKTNAFSRMSNKSLKNSYAALDYKPIQI